MESAVVETGERMPPAEKLGCFRSVLGATCSTRPTWQVSKVTSVNHVTGEKRIGSTQWACDEHKDQVIAAVTHAPVVTAL